MPIPKPIIKDIGATAFSVANIDRKLIDKRNIDDSYGKDCAIDGITLITLAVLQSFIEQGLPRDSERLTNSYNWIIRNANSCNTVMPALVRCNAAIAMECDYDELESDLTQLRLFALEKAGNIKNSRHIPGFLLALECLILKKGFDKTLAENITNKINYILESSNTQSSDLAYALQIAIQYNIIDSEKINAIFEKLRNKYNNDRRLWDNCYMATAYTIIDLSYVGEKITLPKHLLESISTSIDELLNIERNRPPKFSSSNLPDEINGEEYDKCIYLRALIIRAIVRGKTLFDNSASISLRIANAYLKNTYKELDDRNTELNKYRYIFSNIKKISLILFLPVTILTLYLGYIAGKNPYFVGYRLFFDIIGAVASGVTILTALYYIIKYINSKV